jgi:hypothetical protein
VNIGDPGVEQLADAHAGSQQHQDHRPVAHTVQHRQQALHIVRLHGSRQPLGDFDADRPLEHFFGDQPLVDPVADKGLHCSEPVVDRGDLKPAVLLVLNEALQVLSAKLAELERPAACKTQKLPHADAGIAQGAGLKVAPVLVPEVLLELLHTGQVHLGELPQKDFQQRTSWINDRLLASRWCRCRGVI